VHTDIVRGWSDAESKAVIAKLDNADTALIA